MSTGLRQKLLWMIAIRVGIVTLFLGWAILLEVRGIGNERLFQLIGVTYGFAAIWAATLGTVEQRRWIVDLHLAVDILVIAAFIAATGGVVSYFSSLYALPIIAASVLQSRRSTLVVASFAAIMHVCVVASQYQSPLAPSYLLQSADVILPTPRVAVFTLALTVFGFLAVGALAGSLAARLQRADARLEIASTELRTVQALNQHVINSLMSGLITTDYDGRRADVQSRGRGDYGSGRRRRHRAPGGGRDAAAGATSLPGSRRI